MEHIYNISDIFQVGNSIDIKLVDDKTINLKHYCNSFPARVYQNKLVSLDRFKIKGSGYYNNDQYYILKTIKNDYFLIQAQRFEFSFNEILPYKFEEIEALTTKPIELKLFDLPKVIKGMFTGSSVTRTSEPHRQHEANQHALFSFLIEKDGTSRQIFLSEIELITILDSEV